MSRERFYFDYNATSPLAEAVKQWLARGDFSFGNPSSIHGTGKAAARGLTEVKDYLAQIFGLDLNTDLFFHSGATEGINSIIRGLAILFKTNQRTLHFFCAGTDHSCVYEQKEFLIQMGHHWHEFQVDKNGRFEESELIEAIKSCDGEVLLNFTYVNNETGVIWELAQAERIKLATGCLVHIDGVQSIGKIANWNQIINSLDYYTFSAHKFGALKGTGFSLIKNGSPFGPLLVGGGQQRGMRSGTENTMGIYSIKLALEEIQKKFKADISHKARIYFEAELAKCLGDKGEIVAAENSAKACNTCYFILYDTKADILSTAFDIAGIDVSMGSACSSGAIKASRVLKSMGYSERLAKSAIRLSFSPDFNLNLAQKYLDLCLPIVKRFC